MRGGTFTCIIQVSYLDHRVDQNISSGTDPACGVLGCTEGKSQVDFANVRGRAVCTFERLSRVQ